MIGVTVLSSWEYRQGSIISIISVIIFFGILCIIEILLCQYLFKQESTKNWQRVILVILPIVVVFLCFISVKADIDRYNNVITRYEVKIDDSVGFNEFNNMYNIISSSNDVYVVERKPN